MKRFKFRLQKVLDYRNSLKREKELELAQENARLFEAEEQLLTVESLQEAATLDRYEEVCEMSELVLLGEYRQMLQGMLVEQRNLVNQAVEAVEDARNAYIEKAVESEMLETLKEKKKEVYAIERKRAERKESDRLVVARHGLKKEGE